jgi:hypothetical protein
MRQFLVSKIKKIFKKNFFLPIFASWRRAAVARKAHNLQVVSSILTAATKRFEYFHIC